MTLRFGTGKIFNKEQAERRDNAALIQTVCSNALGIPVRIVCEIEESDGKDEKAVPEEPPVADERDTPAAATVGSAGPPGSAVASAGKETGAPSGAANDPAVMKIVEAFDGRIVTD